MMEPHMIGNYIQCVFVLVLNHVGFIILQIFNQCTDYICKNSNNECEY